MLSWMLGLGLLGGNGVAAESGVAATSNAPGPERWPVAGQQGAKVGSTVQNPIRLGAVPDVDTFKKTVRRYVAECDANYRIEGFLWYPGGGRTRSSACFAQRRGLG